MKNTIILNKNKFLNGLRNWIQLTVFILTLSTGFQFYIYVSQAVNEQTITVPRPEGVEAFLPIGALMGWKQFFTTGIWDTTHPAAMVFIGFAVFISLMLRKVFCSWFCPIGTLSEWAWKLGEMKFGKNYQLPKWVDLPLRSVKYLFLTFFVYIIFKMSSADIGVFLESPYYKIADTKMLHFFTQMSMLTAGVLICLTGLSLFFRNFWCRYACPYGALLGIVSIFSPARINRNPDTCTNCEHCYNACPYHLQVHQKKHIVTPDCSGCLDCVRACPSSTTLQFKIPRLNKVVSSVQVGFIVIIVFWVMVYAATITGHWKSSLVENEFRMWLKTAENEKIRHPSVQFKP